MDHNTLTILISLYAAGLSTWLAIDKFRQEKSRLVCIHSFKILEGKAYLEIRVTNISSRAIDLIGAFYKTKLTDTRLEIPLEAPITIESHKSTLVRVNISDNASRLKGVQSVHFESSRGHVFTYELEGTVAQLFSTHLVQNGSSEKLLAAEASAHEVDKAFIEMQKAALEVTKLLKEYEELEDGT